MQRKQSATKLALLATLALTAFTTPLAAQDLLWTRQAGTSEKDEARDVAVDSAGNAYITGVTKGNLGGLGLGHSDAFLAKYDAAGALLWSRQFGTAANEDCHGVAVDVAGNVFVTGWTYGDLAGQSAGGYDVFIAKYDVSGVLQWTRQFGTNGPDNGRGVAVDGQGNAYVSGTAGGSLGGPTFGREDAFLYKYDSLGNLVWKRQLGTSKIDYGLAVATDNAHNVYISGWTKGSLGGPFAGFRDVFLAKYSASGTLLWVRQIGTTGYDLTNGIAVDNPNHVYITGATQGDLAGPFLGGPYDAFLIKYDGDGVQVWSRQIGTSENDIGHGVALDGIGNVYVTGETQGSLGGPYVGSDDMFMAKFDALGAPLWSRQSGTSVDDIGLGTAVDSAGNAYCTGWTEGDLFGANVGGRDLFLIKYSDGCYADCDPSTGIGVLDIFDFLCFQNSFVNSEPYACDCDTSTGNGVCDIFDFLCFQNAFVAGCP